MGYSDGPELHCLYQKNTHKMWFGRQLNDFCELTLTAFCQTTITFARRIIVQRKVVFFFFCEWIDEKIGMRKMYWNIINKEWCDEEYVIGTCKKGVVLKYEFSVLKMYNICSALKYISYFFLFFFFLAKQFYFFLP